MGVLESRFALHVRVCALAFTCKGQRFDKDGQVVFVIKAGGDFDFIS